MLSSEYNVKNGIYKISFAGPAGPNTGIVIIKDGTINGADDCFTFSGTFTPKGDKIHSTMKAKQWNENNISIFGPLKELEVHLIGTYNSHLRNFEGVGALVNNPEMKMDIEGEYLSDIAE